MCGGAHATRAAISCGGPELAAGDVGVQDAIFSAFVDFKIFVFICFVFISPSVKWGRVLYFAELLWVSQTVEAGSPLTAGLWVLLVTGGTEHLAASWWGPEGRGVSTAVPR